MSPRRTKMGTCPLCDEDIYTDQPTAWRVVDEAPARVHGTCLDPQVTRRAVAFPLRVGYAEDRGHKGPPPTTGEPQCAQPPIPRPTE